jgi:hypothetical protein
MGQTDKGLSQTGMVCGHSAGSRTEVEQSEGKALESGKLGEIWGEGACPIRGGSTRGSGEGFYRDSPSLNTPLTEKQSIVS